MGAPSRRVISAVVIAVVVFVLAACPKATKDAPSPSAAPRSVASTASPTTPSPAPTFDDAAYRKAVSKASATVRKAYGLIESAKGIKDLHSRLAQQGAALGKQQLALEQAGVPPDAEDQGIHFASSIGNLGDAFVTLSDAVASQQLCASPSVLAKLQEMQVADSVATNARALDSAGYPTGELRSPHVSSQIRSLHNGLFLKGGNGNARAYLKITNHLGRDAVILLAVGGKPRIEISVTSEHTVTIHGVADGNYTAYSSVGDDWDGRLNTFTRNCSFSKQPHALKFQTITTATQITWKNWTLTFGNSLGGKATDRPISGDKFPF